MGQELRAADLAKLLRTQVFDVEDAARYVGLARNSLEYAVYRKRIPVVQYGAKKLFTKADLDEYAANRSRGRQSKLTQVDPIVVKGPGQE